jgi:hypothetical protein
MKIDTTFDFYTDANGGDPNLQLQHINRSLLLQ